MLVPTSWCLHLNSNWKFVLRVTDYSLLLFIIISPQIASSGQSPLSLTTAGPDLYTSYCQIKLLYFWLNHFDWITDSCSLTAPVHQHCTALLSSLPGLMLLPKLPASQPSASPSLPRPGSRFPFLQCLDRIKSLGRTNSQPVKNKRFKWSFLIVDITKYRIGFICCI